MRRVILICLVTVAAAFSAQATEDLLYTCDVPSVAVSVAEDPEGDHAVFLKGALETPTPNYSYEVSYQGESAGIVSYDLLLLSPGGIGVQMIGTLALDEALVSPIVPAEVVFRIRKGFEWGPEAIHCRLSSAP